MSPTLLPCPFCGSGNVDAVGSSGTCRNCWADGPSRDSRTSAIAAWNARVPSRAAIRAECLREVADKLDEEAWAAGIALFDNWPMMTSPRERAELRAFTEGCVEILCAHAHGFRARAEKEERDGT